MSNKIFMIQHTSFMIMAVAIMPFATIIIVYLESGSALFSRWPIYTPINTVHKLVYCTV